MSAAFVFQMYLMLVVVGLLFLPWALIDRRGAYLAVRSYAHWVRWSARWMVGLRSEIRGIIPEGEVLIAAKHQSFFDAILIVSAVPKTQVHHEELAEICTCSGVVRFADWMY